MESISTKNYFILIALIAGKSPPEGQSHYPIPISIYNDWELPFGDAAPNGIYAIHSMQLAPFFPP